MRNFVLISVLVLFTAALACAAESIENVWQKIDDNNFFDEGGIVKTDDNYYSFMLKAFNKGQYEPIMGRSVWYTISQYTVDCSNYSYKIGVMDSFDYHNNFISGDYNRYAKFQPIIEGTAINAAAFKICKL